MKDTGLGKWSPPAVWEVDEHGFDYSVPIQIGGDGLVDSHQDWFYAFESDFVDEAPMSIETFTLSNVVKDWLGLNSADGKFEEKTNGFARTGVNPNRIVQRSLATMNDNGYTFAEIADTIEQHEDLFVGPYGG